MIHESPQTGGSFPRTSTELSTKLPQEARRSARLAKSLPARITIGEWKDGRRKRFFLRHGVDKQMLSFEHESQRNDAAEKLASEVQGEGLNVLEFHGAEWKAYQDFLREANTSLAELKELHRLYAKKTNMSVADSVTQYRKLRSTEGLNADSLRHTKKILERFVDTWGSLPLVQITPDHIRDWLAQLKRQHDFHPQTLRHHRKEVATLFSYARREQWVRDNPCDAVIPPKVDAKEAAVLGLKDALSLFKEALGSPIASKLALEAFAGLRVSSAARLKPEEIDWEHLGLTLPAAKNKLEKRFYVGPLPENLFTWLKLPGQAWDISESYYDKLKAQVFTAAHVKNPGNVLRHSFCTYHIAAYLDASKTATLLTHSNPAMLYQHYRGKGVTQQDGLAYFQISPSSLCKTSYTQKR